MTKKYADFISTALRDTKAYNPHFNKSNHFSLTFNFLAPKERDLHRSQQNKLTRTLIINLSNTTTQLKHHRETHNIDFNSLTLNILHPSS